MKRSRARNVTILLSTAGYVFATLPLVYSLLLVFTAILGGLVVRDYEDALLEMFTVLSRLIYSMKSTSTSQSQFRSDLVEALSSWERYPHFMNSTIRRRKQLFFMLSPSERNAAIGYFYRLKKMEELTQANTAFLNKVKSFAMAKHGIARHELFRQGSGHPAIEVLDHFDRDWSAESPTVKNRREAYEIFWKGLDSLQHRSSPRILVPGSGVGRLASDISLRFPSAQVDAPELNAGMVAASEFILEEGETAAVIYPYLSQFSHWRHGSDHLQPVRLDFSEKGKPNFMYRNFLEFSGQYDAVATFYFIDTAQNVFSYIEKIAGLLDKGGIWCNHGPMKWGSAAFAELAVDELISYLESSGWEILHFQEGLRNRYNGSERSMLDSKYRLVGWVARRTK